LNTKEDILKNVGNQSMDPTDLHSVFLWMSMATINYLVTNIIQNIFVCVQQKKETQIGLGKLSL